ncbi:unnamed protein product, partial [Laminaria digitata]
EIGERESKRKGLEDYLGDDEVCLVRPSKKVKVTVTVTAAGGGGFGEPTFSEEKQVEVRNRMKLLQFHQDHRPPYWGTWSKTSREVTGRRPLGRDVRGLLNYDYDSEGDWEEEAQGEDLLSDEEGDKEPEDNLDYKASCWLFFIYCRLYPFCSFPPDGWLRQDDEFSDEEIDRFDADKRQQSQSSDPSFTEDSANNTRKPSSCAIGVGEGVRVGAGASGASGGGGGGGGGGGVMGGGQPAFVAALMFRRAPITDEEARAQPALRALSAYRAVAFPGGAGGVGGGGGGGGFPVSVKEAMIEKPRRKDTGEGGG